MEIFLADGCTKYEAKRYSENGTIILEAGEFEKNFEDYISGWGMDGEEIEMLQKMINEDYEPENWSIVHCDGKKYYILYVV